MRKSSLVFVFICLCLAIATSPLKAQEGCRGCVLNIDPDPVGSGGKTCDPATDYNSCMKRCDCQFENNKKKCESSTWCISIALSERNACYGNCLTDWASAIGSPGDMPLSNTDEVTSYALKERLGPARVV